MIQRERHMNQNLLQGVMPSPSMIYFTMAKTDITLRDNYIGTAIKYSVHIF